VSDGVPVLVVPGTDMDGAQWEGKERQLAEWVPRNFQRALQPDRVPAPLHKFVETARATEGIVLDIASGPGGSYCVETMRDGPPTGLLVMSDLGAPVMQRWRKHLREVGWDSRCSNMGLDARRLPFRDAVLDALTSVGGFSNIVGNRQAYAEASRVLKPGGPLMEVVRLYEEGGPTHRLLTEQGQVATTWCDYEAFLNESGFSVTSCELLNQGRGKTDPNDGLPVGDEAWEHRVVFAVRQ